MTVLNIPAEWPFDGHLPLWVTHVTFIFANRRLESGAVEFDLGTLDVPFSDSLSGHHGGTLKPRSRWSFWVSLKVKVNVSELHTNAVASVIAGRNTLRPIRSACNCISNPFIVMPPSTCSRVSGIPQSLAIASRTSRTWKQIASSVARKMCPFSVSSLMPQITLIGLKKNVGSVQEWDWHIEKCFTLEPPDSSAEHRGHWTQAQSTHRRSSPRCSSTDRCLRYCRSDSCCLATNFWREILYLINVF